MIIMYGSDTMPMGLIDEAVYSTNQDHHGIKEEPIRIQYDREYYVFNINNLPEDDMLATVHYLHHYAKGLDHSAEGNIAGNSMSGCVNRKHVDEGIECCSGLQDCICIDTGEYDVTLANGVEVHVYYFSEY